MSARRLRRRLVSGTMTALVAVLSFVAVLALVLILGHLVAKGASSLDWSFFVRSPVPAGQSGGGVANAIVGSVIIVGLAASIGLPIGIGTGLYLAEYGAGRLGWTVRFVADVLNGTPSIVIGIFAWTWLVKPMGTFSALAGSVALAALMVPMIARTTEEMVRLVPHSLREAALALGYPRWRTSLRVIARTAMAGILTGCLVGIARIAGETAPLLFTALGNLNFTTAITQPMQTLSLQIFTYATGPFDEWHRLAWAAALVLMGLVLVLAARLQLETVGLTALYGRRAVVKDVSILFPTHTVTALIGPSGCGKTTFLRCLNRMHELSEGGWITGRVLLDSEDIYDPAVDAVRLRRRIGMVFQRPTPFPTMSIYDNVAAGLRVNGGRPKAELDAAVEGALRRAALWDEVKDRLRHSALALSGGQQQRLCIARALAPQPEVLLLDEPTASLDPAGTQHIEELCHELKTRYTIVIVTHNLQQAARISDYTGFFYLGDLVELGRTEELFTKPTKEQTEAYITGRFG